MSSPIAKSLPIEMSSPIEFTHVIGIVIQKVELGHSLLALQFVQFRSSLSVVVFKDPKHFD